LPQDTVSDDDGGMFWSATVFDQKKGQKFKLRANSDEIRVFPVDEDFDLGTFARFVEFVNEEIDPRAEVVVDAE